MATGNATVTRGNEDTAALEAELHELVTLAEEVVGRESGLFPTVGDGDCVGRLEVAARLVGGVAVDGRVVAGLAVRRGCAVGSINSVEELVEEANSSSRGVEVGVGLVEFEVLRVDDGIGNVKIESSFTDSLAAVGILAVEVDEIYLGTSSLGDLGGVFGEEEV